MSALNVKNLWPLLKQAAIDWSEDKAPKLSAALAYYSFLSIAPLMVISIKIMSMVLDKEAAEGQVKGQMEGLVGSAGASAIQEMIAKQDDSHGVIATIISFVILAISASGVFGELQDSLNTVWEVKPKPNQGIWATIRQRLFSLSMLLVIAFLLLTSLFISTMLSAVTSHFTGGAKVLSFATDLVVSLGAVTLLFAAMFKLLPDARVGWRDVILGAFITAILFTIGKYLLTLYFRFGSTTSAYGAAGSLAAVLIWVYYSGWILFYGAEFTQVYSKAQGRGIQPTPNAVKITDEDRAKRGMIEPAKLAAKASGPRSPRSQPMARPVPQKPPATTARSIALATAGLAVGAVAGVLGAMHNQEIAARAKRTGKLARASIDDRIRAVEARIGTVNRLTHMLDDVNLVDRITAIDERLRSAKTHAKSQVTGRPFWMVRLGEKIQGR